MRTHLLAVLALLTFSTSVFAIAPGASPTRIDAAVKNISTTNYMNLIDSTVRAMKGITVSNTTTSDMQIGIAKSGSSTGSEAGQFIVPASSTYSVLYPLVEPAPVRLGLLSLGSGTGAVSGVVDVSVFY